MTAQANIGVIGLAAMGSNLARNLAHHGNTVPGGTAESWKTLGPILESIAAKVDGEPCATHIGTDGAGHFVKMVHNGIEYADMQVIGEAYDILRRGLGLFPEAIGDVFADWNKGDLDSYLIEITADILHEKDERTGKPLVDVVVDQAGMKGTGTWTVQTALEFGSPVTGIGEAVFARASRMCVVHCSLPRSSPILKDLMRSKTVPSSTAGISTWEPLPRSGAAAALSERNSSTASPTPTPMGTRLPWHLIRISPSSLPMPRIPGAESSRPPLMQVFRHLCSPAL